MASWPAATSAYSLTASAGGAMLAVTVTMDPGALVPAPGGSVEEVAASAAKRYDAIEDQVGRPEVCAWLLTTLRQDGAEPVPLPLTEGTDPLRRFAAGAGLYARAAASLTPAGQDGSARLPAGVWMPYAARPTDTLPSLAALTGSTGLDVALRNASVPGTLAAGVALTVGTGTTETVAGDSLATVLARLPEAEMADLVDAIGDAAVLAAGALLALVGPALPPAPVGHTAVEAAAAFGVDPAAFAEANRALAGILVAGATLAGGEVVAADDSLNSIAARLGAPSAADLIAASPATALFAGGARVLLPPPAATIHAPLGAGELPSPAVPLVVTLRLERGGERADTPLRGPREVNAVAGAVEAALPGVRVATSEANDGRPWVVDLATAGIHGLTIGPGDDGHARAFALRPLVREPAARAGVPVPAIEPDGTLGPPASQNVQTSDVEPWATAFLADLDEYTSPAFAAALERHPPAQAGAERLRQAKRRLAGAVARGLAPVRGQAPPAAVDAARADLAARLAVRFSDAHDIAALAQYEATGAASPAGRLWTALSGEGAQQLDPAPVLLAGGHAYLHLAVTSREPTVAIGATLSITGYETSAGAGRLTFVHPIASGECGVTLPIDEPALPIPSRQWPAPPVIDSQVAEPAHHGPDLPPLAEAALWNYGVAYAHAHDPRDDVLLTVYLDENAGVRRSGQAPDLVVALAVYTQVAGPLRQLMERYLAPPAAPDPALDHAADSLATLALDVAAAWEAHWAEAPARSPVPPDTYAITLRADGGRLRLSLPEGAAPGPVGEWPEVERRAPDGEWLPLTALDGPRTATTRSFAFEPEADAASVLRVTWSGVPLSRAECARASVAVRRNPDIGVADAFVLQTPTVEAAEPVWASLSWESDFAIGGEDLAAALQSAFTTLFDDPPEGTAAIAAGYRRELQPGLPTTMPVLYAPDVTLGPQTAADLAAQMQAWQEATEPPVKDAVWTVAVRLRSRLDGPPRELLSLDRLVRPL